MQGTLAPFTAPLPLPTLACWTHISSGIGRLHLFQTIPFLPDLFVL